MSTASSELKQIVIDLEADQVHFIVERGFGKLRDRQRLMITENQSIPEGLAAVNSMLAEGGFPPLPEAETSAIAAEIAALRDKGSKARPGKRSEA